MDYTILERSTLFRGVSSRDLRSFLESAPHHIQCYDKDETIFHLMENADRIGIILEGRVEAQKLFPNGSHVNVSIRNPGDLIGPAAVFSTSHRYPCDVTAVEPVTLMMFRKEDLLKLMQKDMRIMENLITEIASATYLLQQRLELLSYSGIAQKAAFFLLLRQRETGSSTIQIPDSMTRWASIMNVSRTSLHREIKKLESQGIIQCSSHKIRILDDTALQQTLEG